MTRTFAFRIAASAAATLLGLASTSAQTCITSRVSVDSDGQQADFSSWRPSFSFDGRSVCFQSGAENLVPSDTNGDDDVFVRDAWTGETVRISVASDGAQGNGDCRNPWISGDGRFVAFESWATNLVPSDTNDSADIFVHDRLSGETERVSVRSDGMEADDDSFYPSISFDGRHVAFRGDADNLIQGDTNGTYDVFVHDRLSGETARVSVSSSGAQANDASFFPAISPDGNSVGFHSKASNLVPGDTSGLFDVFVHDRATGSTRCVSTTASGAHSNGDSQHASLSFDGGLIAFVSGASNLVPGDTNGARDIFVRDLGTGAMARVSVNSAGNQANTDSGFNYRDHWIAAEGRHVAFRSAASNLVEDDWNGWSDTFVHDRVSGETRRVSVSSDGVEAESTNAACAITPDGRWVAFESAADNLVPGDTNHNWDVFVHDYGCGGPGGLICAGDGSGAACPCGNPGASGEGCANSSGAGATLAADGSASVTDDDLLLTAAHVLPGNAALLFAGTAFLQEGAGEAFGDGLRCAGGAVVRLRIKLPNPLGTVKFGPGLCAQAGFLPGDSRTLQVWYRDPPGPCGSGFNLTPGLALVFEP